jgi:hypothetical protein
MKAPFRFAALAASIAIATAIATPAHAAPVSGALAAVSGDLSFGPTTPFTNKGTVPLGLAAWTNVTAGAANWTGIDFQAAAVPFGSTYGAVATFGITQVSLTDIDFGSLPSSLMLGQGSGAYAGYDLVFNVSNISNKNKSGNNYSVDFNGTMTFELSSGPPSNAFAATPWVVSFSCSGCTTGTSQNWSANGAAIVPVPGTLALLGLGLIGAAGVVRRSQRAVA